MEKSSTVEALLDSAYTSGPCLKNYFWIDFPVVLRVSRDMHMRFPVLLDLNLFAA